VIDHRQGDGGEKTEVARTRRATLGVIKVSSDILGGEAKVS
jgi:hypothetical protein